MTYISRWIAIAVLIFAPSASLTAESVRTLPAPTGYVSDFAGVLAPQTKYNLENLCSQVDRQDAVGNDLLAAREEGVPVGQQGGQPADPALGGQARLVLALVREQRAAVGVADDVEPLVTRDAQVVACISSIPPAMQNPLTAAIIGL